MTWFAHRRADDTVASLHRERQPGYAEEVLADDAPEVLAMLAPHPRPPTPREWLERLPQAKQEAITVAAAANPSLLLWLLKAAGASVIDVTLAETQEGVAALVAAGVLTADDEAVLLAP